jgi:pro-sigmaK processing inhibitor BofA
MIKNILNKIILSFFILYWFNQIGVNFNLIIPINIITLIIIFLLDIPGLGMLVITLLVLF